MTDVSLRRLTALAGITSVILYALGDMFIADLPPINAPAHLVAAGAFAQDGFFSPSVVSVFVAPPLFFIWVFIACLAVLFVRSRKTSLARG